MEQNTEVCDSHRKLKFFPTGPPHTIDEKCMKKIFGAKFEMTKLGANDVTTDVQRVKWGIPLLIEEIFLLTQKQ